MKWIPAHKTFQEAMEGGLSYEDCAGNGMADCFAKWAARAGGPPADLAEARAAQRVSNELVLLSAGAVLLQRLKARPRTKDDTTMKARKRPAPGLPCKLRPSQGGVAARGAGGAHAGGSLAHWWPRQVHSGACQAAGLAGN